MVVFYDPDEVRSMREQIQPSPAKPGAYFEHLRHPSSKHAKTTSPSARTKTFLATIRIMCYEAIINSYGNHVTLLNGFTVVVVVIGVVVCLPSRG